MTRHLVIVGGGVIGMLSAFAAIKQGLRVTMIDPLIEENISWTGSRIVREEPGYPRSHNCQAWRAVLSMIDYGAVNVRQLHHIRGDTTSIEPDAFIVDTARVRRKLLRKLEQSDLLIRLTGGPVKSIGDCGRELLCADNSTIFADAVIVAAGKGGRFLCQSAGHAVRILHQVFVSFADQDDFGIAQPFIQHDRGRGLWGMPKVGGQAAKISASDLCFGTTVDARALMSSDIAKAEFYDRAKALYSTLNLSGATWHYQSYAASDQLQPYHSGAALYHLACNGGDFKRAPTIATNLLQQAQQFMRTL